VRHYPNYIVGIGGSAGGLNAYKALLAALPPKTGMAFVIASHVSPDANIQLAQLLSKRTKMTVTVAATGMPIRANHVYVCPPNADLLIDSYTFKVVFPRSGWKQIDFFFTSLAEAMGTRAIGIVLSGYQDDGTEGCKHIKAKGGTTFTQDASAEVLDMPLSAQAAGCIDFVLAPDKIPDELQRLASAAPEEKSTFPSEQRTDAVRILIAATPDDVTSIEQILGLHHEYIVVSNMADALVKLTNQAFDLILIGVHFDQSRMFEFLPHVGANPKNADKPIICFSTRDTALTRTMHQSIDVASKALGAWMYLVQQDYRLSKDPDAQMRRMVERCLVGEARRKTRVGRLDIHKQRDEIQHLREALESQEWSEDLEDQVVELRRRLSSLLLQLCESNLNSVSQQELIAYSREQNDQVSKAVRLVEDGAAHKERRLLLDETRQTVDELQIGEREKAKRKKGRVEGSDK